MASLVVGITVVGFAGSHTTKARSLTMRLPENYDPLLTVCTLVRTGEPFEVALTNGKTQTILSGKLQPARNEVIPLELEVARGRGERWDFDRLRYELTLGSAVKGPVAVLTRNHPGNEEPALTLADGGCPTLEDSGSK